MPELILNLGEGGGHFVEGQDPLVQRASDPVVSSVITPVDFAAQYPTPLDTTEIIAMCEEINMWRSLPTLNTELKQETWRELNTLAFTGGSSYISFADGACPEEYYHDGGNTTITLKNIGAKKSLTLSDIKHSAAVAGAGWNGINRLNGPSSATSGLPGGTDSASMVAPFVADLKAKEMELMMTLVLNGWDNLLVNGDAAANALAFDGFVTQVTGSSSHVQSSTELNASGTFAAATFDRFMSEACAKPTDIFGNPAAIQEMMGSYFSIGFSGAPQQVINLGDGNRVVPGFNFAGEVNTGIGRVRVTADSNFAKTMTGTNSYRSSLYTMRMRHNGVPLVYMLNQFPLSFNDLAPGCTAIAFQIWAKTALVIKHKCAHGRYIGNFTGRSVTTCPVIL